MIKYFGILFLACASCFGASFCVGPTATGSGSGADWNNLKAWSATPVRGDTWYLVDGTYASKSLNVANSGTTLITIQKATVASHGGISTGWVDTLGDGVATISDVTFATSNWVLNGVRGNGASVMPADITQSNYGIFFSSTSHPIALTGTASNLTISHCRFFTSGVGDTGIYQADAVQGTKSNITISYCLADGFNEFIRNGADPWTGVIFEYNVILRSQGSSAAHGNAINSMYQPLAITIRYNVFKDMNGDGISGMISGNNSSIGPVLCYGNVFDNIPHCTYIIGANSGFGINNSRFYHNTVITCDNDDAGFAICGRTTGSGNLGANNLLYNVISVMYNAAWTGDYDAFYSCALSSGANKQVASGNPFVNYAGMDYRLLANTQPGTSLGAPYNQDALGRTRTTLTRGAFEFVTGGGDTTAPTLSSATISSAGTSILLAYSETTTIGAGGNGGWTMSASGGAVTMTFSSGSTYTLSRTILSTETVTISYTQPGNGVEDLAGNDFASVSGVSATNGSTQSAGTLSFSASTYSVNESTTNGLTITVARTGGTVNAVTAQYATSSGTATSGTDFTSTSGTVSFSNGSSTSQTFSIPIISDGVTEVPETFTVTLSSPTGGATLGTSTATVTIKDPPTTLKSVQFRGITRIK